MEFRWIVYLDPSLHLNEFKLIKNANLDSFISVQDVRKNKAVLPKYLSVLPALIDTQLNLAWRGESCLSKILTIELPKEHVAKLKRKSQQAKDFVY